MSLLRRQLFSFDPDAISGIDGILAATAPDGVMSNLVNPSTLAPLLYSLSSTFVLIMLGFVVARVYHKTYVLKKYTWDDCKISTQL
jgi:hypothetical protein